MSAYVVYCRAIILVSKRSNYIEVKKLSFSKLSFTDIFVAVLILITVIAEIIRGLSGDYVNFILFLNTFFTILAGIIFVFLYFYKIKYTEKVSKYWIISLLTLACTILIFQAS